MNPNLNAFLTSVRALLMVIGTLMAEQGLDHTSAYKYIMLVAGSLMVVGPAVWGVWSSFSNWRKASAVGVAAGINMTVAGKAVDHEGNAISAFSQAAETPPKAVTVASAADIVKEFAPPTASIAQS